jgi:uncharacterized protein
MPVQGEPRQGFDIVLKVAERCNLACKYCYYYYQEYNGDKLPAFMSDDVIDQIPAFLLASVQRLNIATLNIAFHGGEPLLMRKASFERLCSRLRETLDSEVELRLGLQTNGVLVDQEWIAILSRYDVRVGVSIDGEKSAHDRLRVDHAGRGSYDAAVRGLRMLQDAARAGKLKSVGAIGVIHATDGQKALEHLVFDLGITGPNLNFPRAGWDDSMVRHWTAAVDNHRRLVRFVVNRLVFPKFHFVRGITDVLLTLHSDLGARINDERASRRHNIATISSAGAILPDDNLLSVDPSLGASSLNIFSHTLDDLLASPVWQRLCEAVDHVPPECGTCEWYRSCRSGELYNRYSGEDGYHRKSALCDTIKLLHEEVAEYLVRKKLVTLPELARRLAEAPTVNAADVLRRIRRGADLAPGEAPTSNVASC